MSFLWRSAGDQSLPALYPEPLEWGDVALGAHREEVKRGGSAASIAVTHCCEETADASGATCPSARVTSGQTDATFSSDSCNRVTDGP